jgi:hypothetical protein
MTIGLFILAFDWDPALNQVKRSGWKNSHHIGSNVPEIIHPSPFKSKPEHETRKVASPKKRMKYCGVELFLHERIWWNPRLRWDRSDWLVLLLFWQTQHRENSKRGNIGRISGQKRPKLQKIR